MKSLLDLLPKGGRSLVDSLQNETKFLRRILFLIQEAEEGISHFLKGDLSHFDPHVGDTACQIRAYYFALLWSKREEVFPSLERDLSQLKKYAENLMILVDQGAQNLHRDLRPCSLADFFELLNLSFDLSETALILVSSHFLSKYSWKDEEAISQKINLNLLQDKISTGREFALSFSQYLQKTFTEVSIEFLFRLADRLSQEKADFLSPPELIQNFLVRDTFGRRQLPCLIVFELIVRCLEINPVIPVMLVMSFLHIPNRKFYFFFERNVDQQWVLSNLEDCPNDKPIFLLRGVSSFSRSIPSLMTENFFLKKVNEYGLSNLLRWFGAGHPQYTGNMAFTNISPSFNVFYETCYQNALRHGIGAHKEGGFSLIFKHAVSCRAGEFFKVFEEMPSLTSELTKVVLETCF